MLVLPSDLPLCQCTVLIPYAQGLQGYLYLVKVPYLVKVSLFTTSRSAFPCETIDIFSSCLYSQSPTSYNFSVFSSALDGTECANLPLRALYRVWIDHLTYEVNTPGNTCRARGYGRSRVEICRTRRSRHQRSLLFPFHAVPSSVCRRKIGK